MQGHSPSVQVKEGVMVNSYFYQLVLSQLVLFHWSTRTFLQLVLWSTRTFLWSTRTFLWSTPTFSLVNSYFLKKYLPYALLLYYGTSCALNRLLTHFKIYFKSC